MLKTKKTAIFLVLLTVMLLGFLLYLPNIVIKTIPTANSVTVQKFEFNESAKVSGSITKNRDGDFLIQTFISEKDISNIKIGQQAKITGDAFPDKTYNGEVSAIADTASKIQFGNTTRTMVEVTILISDPDDLLKPGYTATVIISTSEPAVLTILPYEAINQDERGEFVYILEDNAAAKRYITTGKELSIGVEVVDGIDISDTVITADRQDIDGKTIIVNT